MTDQPTDHDPDEPGWAPASEAWTPCEDRAELDGEDPHDVDDQDDEEAPDAVAR